jgi:predicted transcriptional regulator of viral defense system/very-short-patch-repair endonuclease
VAAEAREIWELVRAQHGVITREQLMALGVGRGAVAHRLRSGRLHRVHRGVYAVGRPDLSQHGQWTAAVKSCGPSAVLSHASAAALHGIADPTRGPIRVTVPPHVARVRPGVAVHRRPLLPDDVTHVERVPATTIARTLLDLAQTASRQRLEAAVNAADKHALVDPDTLRVALERYAGRPGISALRQLLDRHTFTLTDSELERAFLPIARRAGLGEPETGRRLNGFKVDFFWPDLGLVVETDGLRYHRTPASQARDRLRDQAQTAAGLTQLRFTHAQVRYEPAHVLRTLRTVARRLGES